MVEKVTDTYPFYQNLNGGPGSGRRPEGGKAIIYPANSKSRFTVVKTKDGSVMTYSMNKLTENPIIEDTKFVIDLKKYPGYQVVKD